MPASFFFVLPSFWGDAASSFDRSEPIANPIPDLKQQRVIGVQILKIVNSMKGAKAVEISDTGPNEARSGPEQWTTCARVEFPAQSLYYSFFVRAEKVIDWRAAVLNDKCETRTYSPAALGSTTSIY